MLRKFYECRHELVDHIEISGLQMTTPMFQLSYPRICDIKKGELLLNYNLHEQYM